MDPSSPQFTLEVVHGVDVGTQLGVGTDERTIGRAVDRDLMLKDLGVSRKHASARATERGILFEVREGAAALLVNGHPFRSVEALVGDRILIGNTTLLVTPLVPAPPSEASLARAPMDMPTVLAGVGADARAMGAIHQLIERMDATTNERELVQALAVWGDALVPSCSAVLRTGDETPHEFFEEERGENTLFVVPAPADTPCSVAFTCAARADRLAPAHRRMLIVAGRLVGSAVARVRSAEVADAEVSALRSLSFGSAREFLGTSPAAVKLARVIPRVAESNANVFLEGETGSGKTFVARLIHEQGPHARGPFRVINCAAIPETLIEAEFFGHERGAFTGAVGQRIGVFESARRGTVFLDEVGELPLASQAKLLRVLEDRKFERIGSNTSLTLEARIIAATNRDIDAMIAQKLFRSDLFFRIAMMRVSIPPLRERGEDVVVLAKQLLADAAASSARRVQGFSEDALHAIRTYSWPGNVRELRNAIGNAVALGEGPMVTAADLPIGVGTPPLQPTDADLVRLPLPLVELEHRAVDAAMRHTNNNRTKAAALLGVSRPTLNARLNAPRGPGKAT